MNDFKFFSQLQCQVFCITTEANFTSCVVSTEDAAQKLGVQPSDILDLVANDILTVRDYKILTLYGTELNDIQKTQKEWLKQRQARCFFNACAQFFLLFPDSELVDSVLLLQKLHVNKEYLSKTEESLLVPVDSNLVFSISKNA